MIDKFLIKNIAKIANHDKIVEHCEPDSYNHQKIEEWMVERVVYATLLLNAEMQERLSCRRAREKGRPYTIHTPHEPAG